MYDITEQEFNRAMSMLKEMAAAGKATGEQLDALGDMIFYGYSQQEVNVEQAIPYWKMAIDKGQDIDTDRMVLVALSLRDGEHGLTADEEKSLRYMQAAADKGDITAEYYSGLWLLQKMISDPQAEGPAMIYLAKAALRNHADAQYWLGLSMLELKRKPEHRGHFRFEYLHWLICADVNGSKEAAMELTNLACNDRDMLKAHDQMRATVRERGCIPPNGTSEVFEIYGSKNRNTQRRKRNLIMSNKGPVDKSKNSTETHSGPGRIVNLEIEKDGLYHPFKV